MSTARTQYCAALISPPSANKFTWTTSTQSIGAAIGLWLSFASFSFWLHNFLTGQQQLSTATFVLKTNHEKATLNRDMESVLPKLLLEKLRKRKLFVRSYEEQQAHSHYFKLV
jgi:hypothetical protein